MVLQQNFTFYHLLFVGSSTWLIYNLHRYFGGQMTTEFSEKPFVVESLNQAILRSAIPFVAIIVSIFHFTLNEILMLAPAGMISMLYVGDLFFKKENTGLRSIPFVKIFLIALVWSIVTVGLPLANHLDQISFLDFVLFMERFFFILAITIPFDIRDLGIDNRGLRTIPQLLGVKKAKLLSWLFLLCSVVCSVILWQASLYTQVLFYVLIPFYLGVGALLYGVNQDRNDLYFSFWIEGAMLVLGLILLACN